MPNSPPTRRYFTEAARIAAAAARKANREGPDTFGHPDMFVVSAGPRAFTWELRQFGGLVLRRGPEMFDSQALARADGELALAALRYYVAASTDGQSKGSARPLRGGLAFIV